MLKRILSYVTQKMVRTRPIRRKKVNINYNKNSHFYRLFTCIIFIHANSATGPKGDNEWHQNTNFSSCGHNICVCIPTDVCTELTPSVEKRRVVEVSKERNVVLWFKKFYSEPLLYWFQQHCLCEHF
jgi:hypothetical protein